jgi:group I intron endonuclease
MWSVYKIECIANGKIYVGSTKNFKRRIGRHFTELERNYHHSPRMIEDFTKYGRDCFVISVIEQTDSVESARLLEGKYIAQFDCYENGYNSTLSGKHFDMPVEIKKQVWLEKVYPKTQTKEWREYCRERANLQFSNPNARKRASLKQKELYEQNPEKWQAIASAAGKKAAKINRELRRKPIRRSDGKIYEAINDAAKDMRPDDPEKGRACIRQALKRGNESMGYKWIYIDRSEESKK